MSKQVSETLREEGNILFRTGDFKGALAKYLDASQLSKDNAVIYSNLAATYIKLQQWDDAIKGCDSGISILYPDRETQKPLHVKLLWRKSLALRNKGSYQDAHTSIKKALAIDPANKTLLDEQKLINEGISKEESSNDLISIPIQEVDEIPEPFFISTPDVKPDVIPSVTDESNQELPDIPANDTNYPAHPSFQFLSTLKVKPQLTLLSYYKYVLLVNPNEYKNIYNLSGIDPEFLDFFLDSCIYVLENEQQQYETNIVTLLTLFKSLPRFTLAATFADSKKVKTLTNLFTSKLQKPFSDFWV